MTAQPSPSVEQTLKKLLPNVMKPINLDALSVTRVDKLKNNVGKHMVIAGDDRVVEFSLGANDALPPKPPSTAGLQLLYEVVQSLSRARKRDSGLTDVLQHIATTDGWDVGIVWTVEHNKPEFCCDWHHESIDAQTLLQLHRRPETGQTNSLPQRVLRSEKLIFVEEIAGADRGPRNQEACRLGITSVMGLPLICGGKLFGIIELFSRQHRLPDPDTLSLFGALSSDIGQFLEAHQLQAKLQERSRRLLHAQRIARLVYWELDLATLKLKASRSTGNALGYPPDQLPRDLHELMARIPEADIPAFQGMLAGAQRPDHPAVSAEHRFIAQDGSIRYLSVNAEGQFSADGRPLRISGTIQDVTEQKLVALREQGMQKRWEVAFRNSPVPTIITETDTGLCLDVNDQMAKMLGQPPEAIIGRTTTELQIWPSHQTRAEFIDNIKLTGAAHQVQFECMVQGQTHHLLINMERIQFNEQDCLFGQWVDITPVKLLEEQLRLTAAAVKHAADALVLIEHNGTIVKVNPAFTHITGYTEEQALGQWFLQLLHKPTGRHDKAFFAHAIETIAQTGQWKGEVWTRHADGRDFPAFLTLSAIYDEETQDITHYVGVFSDVSQQKEYEERLRQLALHDELTGLANRTLLIERGNRALLQAERHDSGLALLFVDLNQFKSVNDRYGHMAGDELLKLVAERLTLCVRASDTVARVGGDEFVILLTDVDADHSQVVIEKINRAMAEPFELGEVQLQVGASVGAACYPQDGLDMPALMRQADNGLYEAKRSLSS